MEYNDGEIYYDNIEIMEKIQQRKNAKMAAARAQNFRPSVQIPKSQPPVEKPPVLPPKKKNMAKPKAVKQPDPKPVKPKALPKPVKPKALPKPPPLPPSTPPSPKPVQVHPGLLRTRSIVEEPLAPIVEEDPTQDLSPRSSISDAHNPQVSVSASRSPMFEKEDFKFGSANETSHDSISTDSSTSNTFDIDGRRDSPHVARRETDFSLHRKVNPSNNHIDDELFNAANEETNVRPYGMVDVTWIENNHVAAKLQQQQHVTSRRNPGESRSTPTSPQQLNNASRPMGARNLEHTLQDTSEVCPYMSIPITMGEHTPPKSPISPLKPVMKSAEKSDKYKDDEYIYDEIDDKYHKGSLAKDEDELQKALTDINEVLETIGNEDISHTARVQKRFPMPAEKQMDGSVSYDNFFYRGGDGATNSNATSPGSVNSAFSPVRPEFSPQQNKSPIVNNFSPPQIHDLRSPPKLPAQNESRRGSEKGYDYFESNNSKSLPRKGREVAMDKRNGEVEPGEKLSPTMPVNMADSLRQGGNESASSRPEMDASSEADSFSHSSRQDTLSSRRKSSGNTSSNENLKGSTRSLGRSSSFERKKSSSFRSKFKFRSRSKSQERFCGDSDSLGHVSNVSDVDEKSKTPRQRGSRLRRRLSRKRMENKESADSKSMEEYEVTRATRPTTPVSFIRKLLRKSKNTDEEQTQSPRKSQINSSGSEDSFSRTSSSSKSQTLPSDSTREKQMISPPSRRARKLLHSRHAREKAAISESSNSDSENSYSRTYNKGEHLKRGDEYLEPCESNEPRNFKQQERGRRPNSQRSKYAKGRRSEKEHINPERSSDSNIHRDKYRALVSLNAQTLKKITEKWLTEWRNKLPVGGFLITSWADIVIASKRPQCILGGTVIYEAYFSTNPGHRLACQIFDKRDINPRLIRQLENCSTLTAHPNLCSVCSHFHCKVPGSLMHPPRDELHCEAVSVVLANVPATSLATYVNRLRELKEQKQVHKQILLMLLQLLQALDNLCKSGFILTNINADNLIVTQEMGLLQILPHMESLNDRSANDVRKTSDVNGNLIKQLSDLLSWIIKSSMDARYQALYMSSESDHHGSHLSALKRISGVLTNPPRDFNLSLLQSLVQCAIWGPRTAVDLDLSTQNAYDALASWIDVKQAELVNNIAVLFSAKSDALPIYMFYKHQYFSSIEPNILFQSLRLLGRI